MRYESNGGPLRRCDPFGTPQLSAMLRGRRASNLTVSDMIFHVGIYLVLILGLIVTVRTANR
jgi:hypothetical protein